MPRRRSDPLTTGKPYTRHELKDALEWGAYEARVQKAKAPTTDRGRQQEHRRRMATRERVFTALLTEQAS